MTSNNDVSERMRSILENSTSLNSVEEELALTRETVHEIVNDDFSEQEMAKNQAITYESAESEQNSASSDNRNLAIIAVSAMSFALVAVLIFKTRSKRN